MGTGKYPEEIVEKVAKAIFEDGGAPVLGKPREWDAKWMTENIREYWRRYARAALDALGLTAEWADYLTNDGVNEYTTTSDCDGSNEERWQRRPAFALRIEATPWEVVDQ